MVLPLPRAALPRDKARPRPRAVGSDATNLTPFSAAKEQPAGPRSAPLVLTPQPTRHPPNQGEWIPVPPEAGLSRPDLSREGTELPLPPARGPGGRNAGAPADLPAAPVQLPKEHHRAQATGTSMS